MISSSSAYSASVFTPAVRSARGIGLRFVTSMEAPRSQNGGKSGNEERMPHMDSEQIPKGECQPVATVNAACNY